MSDKEDSIREYDEHYSVVQYFGNKADSIEDGRKMFTNLSQEERQEVNEAVEKLRSVADNHHEAAQEINEELGPL